MDEVQIASDGLMVVLVAVGRTESPVIPGVIGNCGQRRTVGPGAFDNHHSAQEIVSPLGGQDRVGAQDIVEILINILRTVN